MGKTSVVVLGANGFVGKNIVDTLNNNPLIELFSTSRMPNSGQVLFDLQKETSWENVIELQPDIVIDTTGYGVVKNQVDLTLLYQINYLQKRAFFERLLIKCPSTFWVQIGTAFEYSLEKEALTENSPCFPRTHYGISKNLFSSYLTASDKENYCILRPFGMFGEEEDSSKFFPSLILAQKNRQKIALTDGNQSRDYIYVKDLAFFILSAIENGNLNTWETKTINIGSGRPKSMRELSNTLATQLPNFDPEVWSWGSIPQRKDENPIFYNASTTAYELGLTCSDLSEAFQNTVNYYYNL